MEWKNEIYKGLDKEQKTQEDHKNFLQKLVIP